MLRTIGTLLIASSILFSYSCTKLEEKFEGDLTADQVGGTGSSNAAALLEGVYSSLRGTFTSHMEIFALSGLTTDEAIVPTRGPDWDDNGDWRLLHLHKWNANHVRVRDCFKSLGGAVYAATDLLRFNPTSGQQAEARFLRAWAMYWLLDLYNQVPYREPGESVVEPAKVKKGLDALNFIISEVDAVIPDLPDGPPDLANKYAAKMLLMKCYLNKGVYANRESPSFAAEDMNKVIGLADEIIKSNKFTFSANYFDNFAPDNGALSKENIFTQLNKGGATAGNQLHLTRNLVLHVSQGGWNGWTTLADFYNKFEPSDKRREAVYPTPGSPPNPGHRVNVGFYVGQQYNLTTDVPLTDRTGAPLIFTPEVSIVETGTNLEVTGIRPLKYARDYVNPSRYENDFVYFRLPDVLLMKAEAIVRGGTPTSAGIYGNTALSIVNTLRTHSSRNASALASVNLDDLLDERGRELWWEGWRRQDLIRFGKFLLPFQEKNYNSDPRNLVFPIPNEQIAVNPNLEQNPGY